MALVSDGLTPTRLAWLGTLWLEGVAALAASPISNSRLIVLRENWNEIGDNGASLLSEALKVYPAGSHRTLPERQRHWRLRFHVLTPLYCRAFF
jgi:hypothetical protein